MDEAGDVQGGMSLRTPLGANTEAEGTEIDLEEENLQDHVPDIQVKHTAPHSE